MSHEPAPKRSAQTLAERVAMNVRAELAAQRFNTSDLAKTLNVGPRAAARRLSGELDFSLNELEIVSRWLSVSILALSRSRSEAVAA